MSGSIGIWYMFISGRIINRYKNLEEGIERLLTAMKLKNTLWINYILGCAFCFYDEPLRGTYYLEKGGRYINAAWCQNYLGICFSYLKLYDKAEKHFDAALSGAEYFNMDKLFWHLYTNLSYLYCCKGDFEESIKWSKKGLGTGGDLLLPASNYVDACSRLGKTEEVKQNILPYYEKMSKLNVIKDIKLKLIEYLEKKRKYKEANKLYKELIQNFI
jgi:tetratricopeptide (TPR) repeat protein